MAITTTVSGVLDLYFFIRMFSFVSTPVSFTALRLNLISWSAGLDGWLCCNLYTEGRRARERDATVCAHTITQLWNEGGKTRECRATIA